MKEINVVYLSQGAYETGGYHHEKQLAESLVAELGKHARVTYNSHRLTKLINHWPGYIYLFFWYAIRASAQINIVPLRGAFAAVLSNIFTRHYTLVVLHSEVQPYSSILLKLNYRFLLWLKKGRMLKRCKLVVISTHWKSFFENKGIDPEDILLFPNLFNQVYYNACRQTVKKHQVHLGMADIKVDSAVFKLAKKLKQAGYGCYFSTAQKQISFPVSSDYEVRFFSTHISYLSEMAVSICTVQMPSIDEGWSRVAHESLLVGTPVVGLNKGGLGQLLRESGSNLVGNVDEAFEVITDNRFNQINQTFLDAYDISQAELYAQEIVSRFSF